MLDNILSILCDTFCTVDGKIPPSQSEQTTLPTLTVGNLLNAVSLKARIPQIHPAFSSKGGEALEWVT